VPPFDAAAAGTVGGNGAGLVVLRRLTDALADADPIRAVVRGTAVTNDGSVKVGFTSPGVESQTTAIREAWAVAGLDPAAAQYLEAHGTGTQIGDRIELAAASTALGGAARCGIGSVKSNVGHLDTAAGVAGLIKVVLMLEHRTIAPTVNITRPHPDLERTPLHLVTQAVPWERPGEGPRLAGVTSLGIGGTNVHLVLAEAPAAACSPVADATDPVHPIKPTGAVLLPISARTDGQLGSAARRLAAALREADAPALPDIARTLRTGRPAMAVRACVVAGSAEEAATALESIAGGGARVATTTEHRAATELRPLAETWVRGDDVTWPTGDGRRVHLPTYPFAGDRHGGFSLAPSDRRVHGSAQTAGGDAMTQAASEQVEAAVTGLFMTALGLAAEADLERTYFAAGGDSLTAVHLIGELRDKFGLDVPVALFLDERPVREIIAAALAPRRETLLESLLDEIDDQDQATHN
jgi:3-oxoacyl-[acyl-carrier-protein] synthase II